MRSWHPKQLDQSVKVMVVDQDILEKFGLADVVGLPHIEEARRLAKLRAESLRKKASQWRASRVVLVVKLAIAKHGVLPSVASFFGGFSAAVIIGSMTASFGFWLPIVIRIGCPLIVWMLASVALWRVIRYSPGEAQSPLEFAQAKAAQLGKEQESWRVLYAEASEEVARLTSTIESLDRAIVEQRRRNHRIDDRLHLLALDWDRLSGIEFEQMLTSVYEINGFSVRSTPVTGDHGGDLLVERRGTRTCVQAKRYSSAVGNDAVQQAYAAMAYYECDRCAVVTTSHFTKHAIELAQRTGCELIDREGLRSLIAGGNPQLLCQAAGGIGPAVFAEKVVAVLPKHLQTGETPVAANHDIEFKEDTPEQAEERMRSHAAREWPNDFAMQLHTLDEERSAFQRLQDQDHAGVPDSAYFMIRRTAAREWPSAYSMQLYVTEQQIEAYRRLCEVTPRDIPKHVLDSVVASAQGDWGDDFVMQLHAVEEQLKAYRELHRH